MYRKQCAAVVVATLGILAVAGCSGSGSSNGTSGSPADGSASASTPIASSSAVAKAKQQATACLQQTGTAGLLSSSGRSQLVTCLETIVPPAERAAFKTCMTSAAVSDQVWTKAGRGKFTGTSLQACLNTAAAATPSASLRLWPRLSCNAAWTSAALVDHAKQPLQISCRTTGLIVYQGLATCHETSSRP